MGDALDAPQTEATLVAVLDWFDTVFEAPQGARPTRFQIEQNLLALLHHHLEIGARELDARAARLAGGSFPSSEIHRAMVEAAKAVRAALPEPEGESVR